MKTNFINSKIVFLILSILVAFLGSYFILEATNWGPWAFSDSAAYVSAARNFSGGRGFVIINSNNSTTQVTEFPPFYAFFLSIFLGENGDPNITLRWVNIALFVTFLFVFGCILYYCTHNSLISVSGMLFCVTSPIILEIFSGVMSETLFFPLLAVIILLFLVYLGSENKSVFILLIAFSCLLPITRYAGTLFVIVTGILILFLSGSPLKSRIRAALIYLVVSLLPIGYWFIRLYDSFNKVGGKRFRINLTLFQNLAKSIASEFTVLKTWLPYFGVYGQSTIDNLIFWGSLLLCIGILLFLAYQIFKRKPSFSNLKRIKFLFTLSFINLCAYLLFIAFTHSITIPQIDIINRMLAPIIPLLIALILCFLSILVIKKHTIPLILAILSLMIVLRFNGMQSWNFTQEMKTNGHGYSARQYQESGIIDQLRSLPENQRMVSNSAGFVLYYTNRFPIQIDQFANRIYGTTDGYGEKSFREKGAALILLYPDFRNYYGKTANQLLETITQSLDISYQDEVGGIYYYPLSDPTLP